MRITGGRARAAALLTLTLILCAAVPAPASAVTRSQIISRAKVWTARHVPYSQSRYATEAGVLVPKSTPDPQTLGYRTDCSGFVSLALGLKTVSGTPRSLDTQYLPTRLARISKSQLQRGDVIMRPKTAIVDGKQVAYGHAVIFERWTSSSKTYYWGLHESSSADGAVRAKIRYGVSGFGTSKGFAPYRYIGTRSRARIERKF